MNDYLEHHGVLGQKWGVRRYQNKDGKLTSLGKFRASIDLNRLDKKITKDHYKSVNKVIPIPHTKKTYGERAEKEKENTQRILKELMDSGASINSSGVLRKATIGTRYCSRAMAKGRIIPGTKYKVK